MTLPNRSAGKSHGSSYSSNTALFFSPFLAANLSLWAAQEIPGELRGLVPSLGHQPDRLDLDLPRVRSSLFSQDTLPRPLSLLFGVSTKSGEGQDQHILLEQMLPGGAPGASTAAVRKACCRAARRDGEAGTSLRPSGDEGHNPLSGRPSGSTLGNTARVIPPEPVQLKTPTSAEVFA